MMGVLLAFCTGLSNIGNASLGSGCEVYLLNLSLCYWSGGCTMLKENLWCTCTLYFLANVHRFVLRFWNAVCVYKCNNSVSLYMSFLCTVRKLKTPFMKVEDLSYSYRPLVYETRQWPTPDLRCSPRGCPFDPPKQGRQKQTKIYTHITFPM